jgi:hypothetical protein
MTNNIYDQHRAAFSNVSAYCIVKDGKRIGAVAFKFGAAVQCYFHVFGAPMAKGIARGGNYDRTSAAAEIAIEKHSVDAYPDDLIHINAIKAALAGDSGASWDKRLADAGYSVFQAV